MTSNAWILAPALAGFALHWWLSARAPRLAWTLAMCAISSAILALFAGGARAQTAPTCDRAAALEAYAAALDQLAALEAQLELLQCPTTPPPPPPSAWPSAATTGPAPGTTLVNCAAGSITSSKSGCRFNGAIVIAANNVTIENSEIVAPLSAQYAISDGGTARTGTVLRNLRVSGATGKCIYLSGGNWTGDKLDVFGCEDAVFGSRFTLTNSYLHDVLTGGGRHSDGVQIPSVGAVVLRGNRIEVVSGAANSAVFVQSNFGQVNDVLVEGNLLGGGTYTVYTDAQGYPCPTSVRWLGNTFVRGSSAFGVGNVPCKTASGFRWSGNVYDDGAAVPVP